MCHRAAISDFRFLPPPPDVSHNSGLQSINKDASTDLQTALAFESASEFTLQACTKGWNGTLYYSTNLDDWQEWDGSEISSADGKLYLRGENNTKIAGDENWGTYSWQISGSDGIACSGNIMNLLDYETVSGGSLPTMAEGCFAGLFYGCSLLTSAPELPATTLSASCYRAMFNGCTSLTALPALPATTLTDHCYHDMFKSCTSLTTLPELPATTLAEECYSHMFCNCNNLKLSDTKTSAYSIEWKLPSSGSISEDNLPYDWNYNMFYETNIGFDKPEINKTYYLLDASYLDATPEDMTSDNVITFSSTSEFHIYIPSKTWDGVVYYSTDMQAWQKWDNDTQEIYSSENGKLYLCGLCNTKISGDYWGNNWQLYGQDIECSGNIMNLLDYKEVANGKQPVMGNYCFANMFNGCTALTKAPELPATTLANSCYSYMFYGCANLTTPPSLPATKLTYGCYAGMFANCTKLKVSETQTEAYSIAWTIPSTGSIVGDDLPDNWNADMLYGTDGTFTDNPSANTTYYVWNPDYVLPTPENLTADNAICFTSDAEFTLATDEKGWKGNLFYSTDLQSWNEWDGTEISSSAEGKLYVCGEGNTKIAGGYNCNWILSGDKDIACSGNIMNLLDYKTVAAGNQPEMAERCFEYLFRDCQKLTTAPALPAATLANLCYSAMFMNCTSLTTPPALPATTLAENCYSAMFMNCTSLTTPPALPATTLASQCYSEMFYGCSKLKVSETPTAWTIPWRIPQTGEISGEEPWGWNSSMLQGTGGTFTDEPSANTTYYVYNPDYAKTAPGELTADNAISFTSTAEFTLAAAQTGWNGCLFHSTDLKTWEEWNGSAISSAAGKLYLCGKENTKVGGGYDYRWSITCDAGVECSGNIENLLDYNVVAASEHPEMADYCFDHLFEACPLTTAPTLPATTLTTNCYCGMFVFTELTEAPELPATTLAEGCYKEMFWGCSKLTAPPALPATTLANNCYESMFNGCSSLATAPALPATTLASYCYFGMFNGCKSLTTPPALPATTLADGCYANMFNGCSNIKLSDTQIDAYSIEWRIPNAGEISSSDVWDWNRNMLANTGGTFTGNPDANATYYLWNPEYVKPVPGELTADNAITFESNADFTLAANQKGWNGYLFHSTDLKTWTEWDGSAISSTNGRLYVCGEGNTKVGGGYDYRWSITCDAGVECSGNIENLLDYNVVAASEHPEMADYCFDHLFEACPLTTAPTLPATTLASYCYCGMFNGCKSLTTPPALPATTLAENCYEGMFSGCTGIKVSDTKVNAYSIEWRIPNAGEISSSDVWDWNRNMLANTGGTFTGNPDANATYYLWNPEYVKPVPGELTADNAITFESNADFTLAANQKGWNGYLFHSTDLKTWTEWDGSAISSTNGRLYVCGEGNTKVGGDVDYKWILTGDESIDCSGDIMNLLDYKTVANGEHPAMDSGCYMNLFNGCTKLTKAPELPATTLANYCYAGMFYGCKGLTTPPALPATTLANGCYQSMFVFTELTEAPELPATTLATDCYRYMFWGCSGLTTPPALTATTLAPGCYRDMFAYCTGLTEATELPATTLAYACYQEMFLNCSKLTAPPALPATTLATDCYSNMFNGCTGLTAPPALPATTLAYNCYEAMFYGCKGIKVSQTQTEAYSIPWRIPTTGEIGVEYENWNWAMLYGTGGTFTSDPSVNTTYYLRDPNNTKELPENLTAANVVSFTSTSEFTLTANQQGWDNYLFYSTDLVTWATWDAPTISSAGGKLYLCGEGNTKIAGGYAYRWISTGEAGIECSGNIENLLDYKTVAEGNHPTMADYCYDHLFEGSKLTTAPTLPATTLTKNCYCGMFVFTELTEAPELPATTLAEGCYKEMFWGCSKLTAPPALPATTLANNCYESMFNGCSSIKVSETEKEGYTQEWTIPSVGEILSSTDYWSLNMLGGTSGTFNSDPEINTTYYLFTGYAKPTDIDADNVLTFSSQKAFTLQTNNNNWNGNLFYSTDLVEWNTWDGSSISSSAQGKLFICGRGNTRMTGNWGNSWTLTGEADIECTGNIENLLDYKTVANGEHPAMDSGCYMNLFNGCTKLTKAPELPATTLANYCYLGMFNGCTSLTTLPELPATTLANNCYADMFNGCTSLTTLPELPATTLANGCYAYMFSGCTGIKVSETRTDSYTLPWKAASLGSTEDLPVSWNYMMFEGTGGTFTGSPEANQDYYLYTGDETGITTGKATSISLRLFPNPAHDYVRITGLPEAATTIRIYDVAGRLVLTSTTDGSESQTIDVSGLAKGLHYVRIGAATTKLMIK